jgi:hypothetical protein
MNKFMEFLRKNKKRVIIGSVIAVVLVTILGYFVWRKGVENDGEVIQERLEETYQNAQNSLSSCLDQGRTAAQVTNQEFEELKGLLTDVASARYRGEDGEVIQSSEDVIGGGAAFSAVVEAYPQIDQSSWQRLQSIVVGCRDEFQGKQDRIFAEARALDEWIARDSVWNSHIRNNFPSSGLEVTDSATDDELEGEEALDYITRVIMVDEAREAYETGTLGEQELFPEDEEE